MSCGSWLLAPVLRLSEPVSCLAHRLFLGVFPACLSFFFRVNVLFSVCPPVSRAGLRQSIFLFVVLDQCGEASSLTLTLRTQSAVPVGVLAQLGRHCAWIELGVILSLNTETVRDKEAEAFHIVVLTSDEYRDTRAHAQTENVREEGTS